MNAKKYLFGTLGMAALAYGAFRLGQYHPNGSAILSSEQERRSNPAFNTEAEIRQHLEDSANSIEGITKKMVYAIEEAQSAFESYKEHQRGSEYNKGREELTTVCDLVKRYASLAEVLRQEAMKVERQPGEGLYMGDETFTPHRAIIRAQEAWYVGNDTFRRNIEEEYNIRQRLYAGEKIPNKPWTPLPKETVEEIVKKVLAKDDAKTNGKEEKK